MFYLSVVHDAHDMRFVFSELFLFVAGVGSFVAHIIVIFYVLLLHFLRVCGTILCL